MNQIVHLLKTSPLLVSYAEKITTEYEHTVQKINSILPVDNFDLVIYDDKKAIIPELGISGRTINSHTIFMALDCTHQNFSNKILAQLKKVIAHKIHHIQKTSLCTFCIEYSLRCDDHRRIS